MHHSGWVELVRKIPPDYHAGMNLVMQSGLELVVQTFLRLEEQFMVCRGRPTGSSDASLIFFVPYDQIVCMGYTRALKEEMVRSWFPDAPIFALGGPAQAPG